MPRIEMLRASANRLPRLRKPFSETLKTTIRMTHIANTAVVWLGLRQRAASPTGGMSGPPLFRILEPSLTAFGFIRQILYPIGTAEGQSTGNLDEKRRYWIHRNFSGGLKASAFSWWIARKLLLAAALFVGAGSKADPSDGLPNVCFPILDAIKRRQLLAKAGARLAELLNAIWH